MYWLLLVKFNPISIFYNKYWFYNKVQLITCFVWENSINTFKLGLWLNIELSKELYSSFVINDARFCFCKRYFRFIIKPINILWLKHTITKTICANTAHCNRYSFLLYFYVKIPKLTEINNKWTPHELCYNKPYWYFQHHSIESKVKYLRRKSSPLILCILNQYLMCKIFVISSTRPTLIRFILLLF